MTHDEMIAMIRHHKNGGKVECRSRSKSDCVWINEKHIDACGFNFAVFDYRCKPEPITLNVIYDETMKRVVTFESESRPIGDLLDMQKRKYPSLKFSIKKFVEVEE